MSGTDGAELSLRDYLQVLSRRRGLFVGVVVVAVGVALLLSYMQEPVYAGKARILLQARADESPFDANTGQRNDPDRALATEIEVLRGEGVRGEVRKLIGSAPKVSAHAVGTTDVVEVVARNTNPRRAAEIANAYANSYIDFKRRGAVDSLLAAAAEIQDSLSNLQRQIDALDAQVAQAPANEQALVRDTVNAEKNALVQQMGVFKQTLDQLQVNARLRTGGAQLVGNAVVPTSPVSPKPLRNAVLASVLGLILAAGLCFAIEFLDDSIGTQEELEKLTGTVPVIAVIPAVRGWKAKETTRLVAKDDPRSPAAESYRTLRTAIQFLALDHPMRIVQVTSPQAGEGKSTTLANLAVTLGQAGQRVIVVCCDLRRPRIHEFFGLSNSVGLTSVLVGEVALNVALQSVPNEPRIKLLASGALPPNPSELLSLNKTAEVLIQLKEIADIVLIDSPPVLPVSDALVLFRHVEATLMVFSALSTSRKQATMAVARAQQVDAPLVGAVLNGVSSRAASGYGYGYEYEDIAAAKGASASNGHRSGSEAAFGGRSLSRRRT